MSSTAPATKKASSRKTKTAGSYKPRASLQPGAVLILLAGRFRGKRVVLLKTLANGVLLVTGPFKVNGVPLRRVNARYVIATSTVVPLTGVDSAVIERASDEKYFNANKKAEMKASAEAFFKQSEAPQKKELSKERVEDQKSVDKAILAAIKKEPFLASYLANTFALRNGDRPHEMQF